MAASRSADVGLADDFFADEKALAGAAPEIGPKKNKSGS